MSEEDDTLHCTLWGTSGQSAIRNPHPHREDRSASPDLLIVEIPRFCIDEGPNLGI